MKTLLLSFLCSVLLVVPSVNAQEGGAGDGDILAQSMSDAITVGAIGGIGAVLGLSTLSFVEEPSEHLKNIVVGGAIGIIVGVGVIAFKQANMSKDLYQESVYSEPEASPGMTTAMRVGWHKRNHYQINSNLGKENSINLPGVNLQFSF